MSDVPADSVRGDTEAAFASFMSRSAPALARTPLLLCGDTHQACREADLLVSLGYHAGLLSLAALSTADDDTLVRHCEAVATRIPVIGFYLQPSVGGRRLSYAFWIAARCRSGSSPRFPSSTANFR